MAAAGQYDIAAHADDADLVLVHDGAYLRLEAGQHEAPSSVPVYGRVATFVPGGSHDYALAYALLWPHQEAEGTDLNGTHPCSLQHLRVVVDRGTCRLEKVCPGSGKEGSEAWLEASKLKFADHATRHPRVCCPRHAQPELCQRCRRWVEKQAGLDLCNLHSCAALAGVVQTGL